MLDHGNMQSPHYCLHAAVFLVLSIFFGFLKGNGLPCQDILEKGKRE